MNTLLCFLTVIAVSAADWDNQAYEPATGISEGPWVEENLWDNRDPKGIMDTLPSPTQALSKFSSFWTWDR